MATDHLPDEQDTFEREVRAALRRRAGDPAAGTHGLRVAVDGAPSGEAQRPRLLAVLLCLVAFSLIATVLTQVF